MSDYLPQDVLIDILTRLPAESLVRLTPVCKSWHSLITSPKFISHHLHRTASNPDNNRLLVRYRTDIPKQDHYSLVLDGNDSFRQLKTFDYPFDSVGYSVVGSCNGVICLSDDQEYGYMDDMFLWNPSIRKFFAIPTYNVTFE
ncbi:F-box protein At3g07870-like [Rhododendron vialii]|uniref:F-box protein At3g07870-like n=1 Tax=Rhododendron vialii TaxID=182163 RepID=UPI00265F659E|nr:F-box protein At3g07870-like [Rhododendron vialii]